MVSNLRYVSLSLAEMALESGFKLSVRRRLGHLRQGFGESRLGIVEVGKLRDEQIVHGVQRHAGK